MMHNFSDEFIAKNKDYLDFLLQDNLSYLKLGAITLAVCLGILFAVDLGIMYG